MLNDRVVPARLDATTAAVVGLDLSEATEHRPQIVGDRNDLAVGDADEFARVGRGRVGQRLTIDAPRQILAQLESSRVIHLSSPAWAITRNVLGRAARLEATAALDVGFDL